MRYFLIAGEASGDMHGANLMRGIALKDPKAEFRFWGGDLMAAVGGEENLARHYKTTSFFGFVEVVRNLPTIFRQLGECRTNVASFNPDVLILIDYPGFNFKMARWAHKAGYKVFYYISPKVWAWKQSRVKLIRRYVDKLFVIFPFEVEYFRKRGIEVVYEGNPSVDVVGERMERMVEREQFFEDQHLDQRPLIALLAGSRKTEVKNNLPFMCALARRFPDCQFVVAAVSWLDSKLYDSLVEGENVRVVTDKTYETLRHARAAVVCSGTATLEAALIGTPQVVCYRADALSVWVGRNVIKIRYISLVNILLDKHCVKELIQGDMNVENASEELQKIVVEGEPRQRMLDDYARLARLLGSRGCSVRVGGRMVELINNR